MPRRRRQKRRRGVATPPAAAMASGVAALRAAGIGAAPRPSRAMELARSGAEVAWSAARARRGPLFRGAGLACALVLLAGLGDAAPGRSLRIEQTAREEVAPVAAPAPIVEPSPPPPTANEHTVVPEELTVPAAVAKRSEAEAPEQWGASLRAVRVTNGNTNAHAELRLYSDHGSLELAALHEFMRVAASVPDAPDQENGDVAEALDARLVQLVFRAAYHFDGAAIVLVSGRRRGAHGKHGTGEALDFQLEDVPAAKLAAYVRTFPRAGIGVYTHPKTQYVHVDVRERSYHWIDASPPGVTWLEKLLPDPKQEERDASYDSELDLPEIATP